MRTKNQKQPRNRKTKEILVFDEKAREEYLTGFSKRKKTRQKKAQEEVGLKIKEERKLLKQKRKEFLSGSIKGKYQTAPVDLEEITESQVTELPEHTVTITDVSEVDLAGQGGVRLGLNKFADKDETATVSDEESQVPETSSKISKVQQHQILRQIGARINKRQKHVKLKTQQNQKKGRIMSKKKKHHKKPHLLK